MEINEQEIILNCIRDGIRDGIKARMTQSYNNPLDKVIESAIARHSPAMHAMLDESISSCVGDQQFRNDIAQAVRQSIAKTLVARFGGEVEKQVNVLKSDPATRARITLAIEEIVKTTK